MTRPAWVLQLEADADRPPLRERQALHVAGAAGAAGPVGSVEPTLAQRLVAAGLPLAARHEGWEVQGDVDAGLESIARFLDRAGLAGRWRGEQLAVTDDAGRVVGAIERGAVRPLGIATHAVHLIGRRADGALWLQQRALDKATDPGRWDTLMGGLIAAGETVAGTLARETWEEAGLRLAELQDVVHHGRFTVRRPVHEGYMVEYVEVYSARVPDALQPVNQDGEVERFECVEPGAVVERLRAGAFTLEAALVLLQALPALGA